MDSAAATYDDGCNSAFEAILQTFADIDLFSGPASPTIFPVYAHDRANGSAPDRQPLRAYSNTVKHFIKWLRLSRARALSDRHPLPVFDHETRPNRASTCNDILENQFCLLPKSAPSNHGTRIERIDKVIVYGSPVLRSYRLDPFAEEYINEIKRVYSECLALDDSSLRAMLLEQVITPHHGHPSFHHVLTELAFLELRHHHNPSNHGIVLVSLDNSPMDYLAFPEPTHLRIETRSEIPSRLHRRFFKLLYQIFTKTEKHTALGEFEKVYDHVATTLEQCGNTLFQSEIEERIKWAIKGASDELMRHAKAQLRALDREIQNKQLDQAGFTELEKDRNKLLRNLATIPYLDRKNVNPERVPGTCKWFENHPLFLDWRAGTGSPLLWVSALPGAGKSVLFKHLVDNVLPAPQRTNCYFFFKDIEDQKSAIGALRCLLHQMFSQRPDLLRKAVLQRFARDSQILQSFEGLWEIFLNTTRAINTGEIVCVIDALDECQSSDRLPLLKRLAEWSNDPRTTLKIIVSSRLYKDIRQEFHEVQAQIHLSGEGDLVVKQISEEIDMVIAARLKIIAHRLGLSSPTQEALQQKLTSQTQRTYLWAYLVLDELEKALEFDKRSLQATIETLPSTVEEAYDAILNRSGRPERVKKLLTLILAARNPLTLRQMAEVWALEADTQLGEQLEVMTESQFTEMVTGLCGLFVVVSERKLFLLHQTASEFLLHHRNSPVLIAHGVLGTSWKNSIAFSEAELSLARACIQLLAWPGCSLKDWYRAEEERRATVLALWQEKSLRDRHRAREERMATPHTYQFTSYALTHVFDHLRSANSSIALADLQQVQTIWQTWRNPEDERHTHRTFIHFGQTPWHSTPMIIASWLGTDHIVKDFLQTSGTQMDYRDSIRDRTALHWAVLGGNLTMVELLLEKGCSPNTWDFLFDSPLHSAISARRFDVATLLLQYRAEAFTAHNGEEPAFYLAACCGGQGDPDYLQLLNSILTLCAGVDINMKDAQGTTALGLAARYKHHDRVELLLNHGADIYATDGAGRTALHEACQYGRMELVKLLLRHGAVVDNHAADRGGKTALHVACEQGRTELVELLLGHGADVDQVYPRGNNRTGWTALHIAALAGHTKIIERLLAHKASISSTNESGETALDIALKHDHIAAAILLIKEGARMDRIDTIKGALIQACGSAQVDVAASFFRDNPDARLKVPYTVFSGLLWAAARAGDIALARLLLANGAKPHDPEARKAARENGQQDFAQMLALEQLKLMHREASCNCPGNIFCKGFLDDEFSQQRGDS